MFKGKHFIKNKWLEGEGDPFRSINPATNEVIWEGRFGGVFQVDQAVRSAEKALHTWRQFPLDSRIEIIRRYQSIIEKEQEKFAVAISEETGKPLWESRGEVGAMIKKIDFSIQAIKERNAEKIVQINDTTRSFTRYKGVGVIAVIGPFNFPGHLPNGHIIPALLAGNTIVFKPSEQTPAVGEYMIACMEKVGFPVGTVNLVHGEREIGSVLTTHPLVSGTCFTGSSKVGLELLRMYSRLPQKQLALEMGGNNPLIISDFDDLDALVALIIQSAFITTGQRCSCARRLIVVDSNKNKELIAALVQKITKITIGDPLGDKEPFMGPLISMGAKEMFLDMTSYYIGLGAKPIVEPKNIDFSRPFVSPGIIDGTNVILPDKECFGPLLNLIWVPNLEEAIRIANNTKYGLAASIITANRDDYERAYTHLKAGVINWNKPTTGAYSGAPFGGVGHSGNFKPSGYFASDYVAYPVASLESETLQSLQLPGFDP